MLPEPSFVERDGAKILAECVAYFEAATQQPLAPAQAERLLINMIAYRELLIRIQIQEAAKQNLIAYARYPMLDHVVKIGGVERVAAKAATTTERFSLPAPALTASTIPVGTRVRTKDGKVVFTTDEDKTIGIGVSYVDVGMTAAAAGPAGNGYVAGQVTEILDDLPFAATAANLTETDGGAPSETTDAMRERAPKAIRALSVAGPEDAYAFFALTAHPTIIDVDVTNPEPRTARIHVLTDDGIPSSEVLDLVDAACSPKTVRPLTDIVDVVAAEAIEFEFHVHLTLRKGLTSPQQAATLAAATLAANAFVAHLRAGLNRAYVDSQAYAALSVDGVYSVTIEAVDPHAYTVGPGTFAACTSVTVDVVGYEP